MLDGGLAQIKSPEAVFSVTRDNLYRCLVIAATMTRIVYGGKVI